jgi:hypothetical protein
MENVCTYPVCTYSGFTVQLLVIFRLAQKIMENAVNHIVEDIENACDQIVDNIYSEEIGQ